MEGTVTGSSVLAELWALVKLSAPLSATKFIVSVGRVVNVGFVGRITDGRSLAAVSLASTFAFAKNIVAHIDGCKGQLVAGPAACRTLVTGPAVC